MALPLIPGNQPKSDCRAELTIGYFNAVETPLNVVLRFVPRV